MEHYRLQIFFIKLKRLVKKLKLKLKNKFHLYKNPIFLKDVDIDNILISDKIFFNEKYYKYFIVYINSDYKIKSFSIIFPKTSAYVKSYNSETNECIF